MAGKCGKCSKQLPRKQFLTCSVCNVSYDIDCAGAEKRFFIMNDEHKRRWRCISCSTKTPSINTKNTIPAQMENVTFRNKRTIVNISTSNSYLSLIDDGDDETYSTFQDYKLNRSCPDLSTTRAEDLEELKQKILNLQSKLNSAESEIENLILDNNNLREKLAESELKINCLKQVCSSSRKPRKKRKEISEPESSSAANQSFEELNKSDEKETKEGKPVEVNEKKKNIYIFGDQQIRGLAVKLLETRIGKWNDEYNVTSIIKPQAQSSDILTSLNSCVINRDDVIVLSIGSNDINPYLLYSNVCNVLGKYDKCKIFVIKVRENRHLNIDKLNFELEMLTRNYDNCTYLTIDNNNYKDFRSYLQGLTFKINIEIDFLTYKKDYIDVGITKKSRVNVESNSKVSLNHSINIDQNVVFSTPKKNIDNSEVDAASQKSPQTLKCNKDSQFFREL